MSTQFICELASECPKRQECPHAEPHAESVVCPLGCRAVTYFYAAACKPVDGETNNTNAEEKQEAEA
jgi:hypothetical protein